MTDVGGELGFMLGLVEYVYSARACPLVDLATHRRSSVRVIGLI